MSKALERSLADVMYLEEVRESRYFNAPTTARDLQLIADELQGSWNSGQFAQKFLLCHVGLNQDYLNNSLTWVFILTEPQEGSKQPIAHKIVWSDPKLMYYLRTGIQTYPAMLDKLYEALYSFLTEQVCDILRKRRRAPKPTRNKRYDTTKYKPRANRKRINNTNRRNK